MGREQSIMVLQEDALSKLAMSLSMTTLATFKKTHTQHPPPSKKKLGTGQSIMLKEECTIKFSYVPFHENINWMHKNASACLDVLF